MAKRNPDTRYRIRETTLGGLVLWLKLDVDQVTTWTSYVKDATTFPHKEALAMADAMEGVRRNYYRAICPSHPNAAFFLSDRFKLAVVPTTGGEGVWR